MKRNILCLAALFFAAAFSAFTLKGSNVVNDEFWVEYTGPEAQTNVDAYDLIGGGTGQPTCEEGLTLCAILVPDIDNDHEFDQDDLDAFLEEYDTDEDDQITPNDENNDFRVRFKDVE